MGIITHPDHSHSSTQTMASLVPGMRRLVYQAPTRFFACNQCLARQPTATSRIVKLVRWRGYASQASPQPTTPLNKLAQDMYTRAPAKDAEKAKRTFPETSSKGVAYWLLGSAASVFGIVVFGGLTRLTESGLSITEWRPVTGSLPPMSQEDWESEFAKYRASPEFKLLNPHMTLSEFKKIYYMEWTHRLWGRFIGMAFVLPAVYFVARKRASRAMSWNLLGMSALIGFQGFIGWWMVKSGLKDDLFEPGSHPRVSQYRLTAHLGAAFVCYLAMLWNGLDILRTNKVIRTASAAPEKAASILAALRNPALKPFKRSVGLLALLVFVTAMSGGLVAGLDAGLIYNEFPYMGLGLTPPKSELWDKFYSRAEDGSDLWWRNMLENPSLVQLDHRILATTTFTAICALWSLPRLSSRFGNAILRSTEKGVDGVRKSLNGVLHLALLQVTLGISTLIYMVPTWLAAGHQAGALALLTGVTILASRLRISPRTMRLVREAAARQGAKTSSSKQGPAELKKVLGNVEQVVR